MASVEEVLAAMVEPNRDEEELCFVIDKDLRLISVPERGVVLGVEGDKDVNRVRFRMNRFYHGSDLSEFCIRINYQNADGDINYFTVTEKTVETDSFCFIWTVAADATMVKGTVLFVVNCFMTDVDGVVQKAYHTTLGAGTVLEGLEPYEGGDIPEIVDYLTHLKNDLMIYSGTLVTGAEDAAAAASRSAATSANAAKTSETNVVKLLDSITTSYNGGVIGSQLVKIPVTRWSKSDSDAAYSCTLEKAECTAFLVPIATVEPDDVPSAIAAGLYGTCQALDGALKFWSKTKPTKELTIAVVLLEPDIKQKG